jgi:hypothetical protein
LKPFNKTFLPYLQHPKTSKILAGLIAAISLLFLFQTFRKAYRPIGFDLTSYLLSSEALLSGANPYQTETVFPFIYPLFLCVALIPLALLPYWLAVFIWFIANLTALFFTAKRLLNLYKPDITGKGFTLLFCFSFLLLFGIISNNFLNGQINILVLFLCTLFLWCYLQDKKLIGSWFLAAAVVIKLTPAILFVYLFFKKDFKTIFLVLLQCLILALALPMLIAGTGVFDLYEHYFQAFILSKLSAETQEIGNNSFALMPRLQMLFPQLPGLFSFCLSGALALAPAAYIQLFFKNPAGNGHARDLLLFALYMLGMLFLGPMSEKHHLIYVYPSVLIILICLSDTDRREQISTIVVLVLVTLLLALGKVIFSGFFLALLLCYGFAFRKLLLLHNPYAKPSQSQS